MQSILKVFVIILFFFVALLLFALLNAFIANLRLYAYLKKTNYKRWCELTTIGSIGPGAQNTIRFIKYINNDLDTDDEKILRYKHKISYCLRYSFWFFLGIIVHIIMLFYFIK